jgi:hypothetical protein
VFNIRTGGSELRVTDGKGRVWVVKRRFAPWRRVLRLFALATGRYREGQWRPRSTQSSLDAEGSLVVLVYGSLLGVVLLPLTLLELAAQGIAGGVLAALRASGVARYRVDVLGLVDKYVHSETVLLVRKDPGALVEAIAAERNGAGQSFQVDTLPEDVHVERHRSLWQATSEWV